MRRGLRCNGRARGTVIALFVLLAVSHVAMDMATNGGLGIALFSPFDAGRHFLGPAADPSLAHWLDVLPLALGLGRYHERSTLVRPEAYYSGDRGGTYSMCGLLILIRVLQGISAAGSVVGSVIETKSAFGPRYKSSAAAGLGFLDLVRANGQDAAQPGCIDDQWSVKGIHAVS